MVRPRLWSSVGNWVNFGKGIIIYTMVSMQLRVLHNVTELGLFCLSLDPLRAESLPIDRTIDSARHRYGGTARFCAGTWRVFALGTFIFL